ncbi:hypothetical protein, partial [Staphylococcus aureus]|uniref:hypothetical protein n=1 Tax=Staphylococcus aureus TaxID=1280 RepID=UPI0011A8FC85
MEDLINGGIEVGIEGDGGNWSSEKYWGEEQGGLRKYDERGEVFRDENEYWGEGDWIIEGELG